MLLFYTYILVAYLPAITVIAGIPLLIAGIILKKKIQREYRSEVRRNYL